MSASNSHTSAPRTVEISLVPMFKAVAATIAVFVTVVVAFVVLGASVVKPLSQVIPVPRTIESVMDRTNPGWRPVGFSPIPCADTFSVHIIGDAEFTELSVEALGIVSEMSGLEFELTDNAEAAFITLESKVKLSEYELGFVSVAGAEEGILGVTLSASRWVSGEAAMDFSHISVVDLPGVTVRDFSSSGLGTTLVHEIGHALGLDHSDEAGHVMSATTKDVDFITATDRGMFTEAVERCVA